MKRRGLRTEPWGTLAETGRLRIEGLNELIAVRKT